MTATQELAAVRAGQMTFDRLVAMWSTRTWAKPSGPEPGRTVPEVWEQVETAGPPYEPGTWGEVRSLYLRGLLTQEEYERISKATDATARR
jgi:hypothetical protein